MYVCSHYGYQTKYSVGVVSPNVSYFYFDLKIYFFISKMRNILYHEYHAYYLAITLIIFN